MTTPIFYNYNYLTPANAGDMTTEEFAAWKKVG